MVSIFNEYNERLWDITLVVMGVARNKTPDAPLHMMVNMPVKFYDCGVHTFGLERNTGIRQRQTDG